MNITESKGVKRQILGIESAPFIHSSITTQKIMLIVLLAMLPALFVQFFYFGAGIIWQFLISAVTAVICEALVSLLRQRKLSHSLSDLSYLVTAMILAFTLPPLLPCYYTVIATVFAIVVVKAIFGGLGHNIFNPAMAGFIFIVISSPQAMNTFIIPAPNAYTQATFSATYDVIFNRADETIIKNAVEGLNVADNNNDIDESIVESQSIVDTFTGATYLETIKSSRKTGTLDKLPGHDFLQGNFRAYLALAVAYAIGGIILIYFKIILVKMLLSFSIAFIALQGIMHHIDPGHFMSITDGILFGGTCLAAFFIITDPVTNAGTSRGRIYFAIIVAFLIVFIRAYGSYSDAVAFAVMLGNAASPLIDVLTRRRSFGINYKKDPLK